MKPISKLFLTVALLCWGSVALAASNPVPGVDVVVRKKPGGVAVRVVPNSDGTYQFSSLPPGDYELCVADEPCKSVAVGKQGTLMGQAQKHHYIGTVTLLK